MFRGIADRISIKTCPMAGILLLVMVLVMEPVQAAALSCASQPPQIIVSSLRQSNTDFRVVKGTIQIRKKFKLGGDSKDAPSDPDREWRARARVKGVDLATGKRFNKTVTVNRNCLAVWCGAVEEDVEALFILTGPDRNLVLDVGPCGGRIFGAYYQDDYESVERCLKRGECE